MVIDVKACIGCRRCVYACVKENNIGRESGFTYIQVLEMENGKVDIEHANLDYEEAGRQDKWYLPVQCMHCAKPTCVYGCPVKATWKEPDGIVVIDYDKCIACRNCMITCPYDARHFNWVEPEVPEDEVNPRGAASREGGRRREVHVLRPAHAQRPDHGLHGGLPGRRAQVRRSERSRERGLHLAEDAPRLAPERRAR